jgi:hypothetical protein
MYVFLRESARPRERESERERERESLPECIYYVTLETKHYEMSLDIRLAGDFQHDLCQ